MSNLSIILVLPSKRKLLSSITLESIDLLTPFVGTILTFITHVDQFWAQFEGSLILRSCFPHETQLPPLPRDTSLVHLRQDGLDLKFKLASLK